MCSEYAQSHNNEIQEKAIGRMDSPRSLPHKCNKMEGKNFLVLGRVNLIVGFQIQKKIERVINSEVIKSRTMLKDFIFETILTKQIFEAWKLINRARLSIRYMFPSLDTKRTYVELSLIKKR